MADEEFESTLYDDEPDAPAGTESADAFVESAPIADDDIDVVIDDTEDPVDEPTPDPEPEPVAATAAETPGAEVTDADLEEGDRVYPESIKKRIKREIRIRKQVQAEAENIRGAAIQAIQIAQQKDAELTELKATTQHLRKQHADILAVAYEKELAIKTRDLRIAREDGNYDTEMAIQAEVDKLRFQSNQIAEARRAMDNEAAAAPTPKPQAAPQPAPQPQAAAPQQEAKPLPPNTAKWLESNKTWFDNPKFRAHRQFTVSLDEQLAREGFNPQTAEYFVELDRRIDEAFPTLRKRTRTAAGGSAPPVGAVGSGVSQAPRGTVRLNRTDLNNMKRFGLDIHNKEHLREYARNKHSNA